jgi:colanic acid biosynthesis protein WcaH
MFLDKEVFSTVIESTPLVSIDLVVLNKQGQALLGQRLNKPAQGNWFVPGGRILKDEAMADAFKRLTKDELGSEYSIDQAELLGPFDHFYIDNVFSEEFSTHYVAIAYVLKLDLELNNLPMNIQHNGYKWFDIEALKIDEQVHLNTKRYFNAE